MPDVVFNPDEFSHGGAPLGPRRVVTAGGGLTRLTMKVFGLKSEATANKYLGIVALSFFILTIIVLWRFVF